MNENSQNQNNIFDEPVGNSSYVDRQINSMFERERFRQRVNEVIEERTNSVPFMKKVQNYADEQIDARLFKNVKVMGGLILGWIITAVVSFAVAWFTK